MTNTNWGALFVFAQKVADEVRLNAAPPAPDASSDPVDMLTHLQAVIPAWQAAWVAHQGVATGLADLLERLADSGVPYAATIRNALLSTPGALAEAEKWLPTIIWALTAFKPAAPGIQGDNHFHVGRG